MRKLLLLAPPLATLLFMVGCNTCNTGTCDTAPACGPAVPGCTAAAVADAPVVVATAESGQVVDSGFKAEAAQAAPIAVASVPQLVGVGVDTPGEDNEARQMAAVVAKPNPDGGEILTEAEYARLLAEGKVTAIPGYTPSEEVAVTKSEAKKTSAVALPVTEMAAKTKIVPAPADSIVERRAVTEAPILPTAGKAAKDDAGLSTKEVAVTADQLVSPSMVITPAQVNQAAVAAPKTALVATAPAAAPAPAAKVVSSGGAVPTIPGMPLPEGWDYIHELDLSGGKLNTVAYDQLYSTIPSRINTDI